MIKLIVKTTALYDKWFKSLKDIKIKTRISTRIDNVSVGHFGDFKSVGDGVFELRFKIYGGLRIYYTVRGGVLVLLLVGGNKGTQKQDIKKAKELAKE